MALKLALLLGLLVAPSLAIANQKPDNDATAAKAAEASVSSVASGINQESRTFGQEDELESAGSHVSGLAIGGNGRGQGCGSDYDRDYDNENEAFGQGAASSQSHAGPGYERCVKACIVDEGLRRERRCRRRCEREGGDRDEYGHGRGDGYNQQQQGLIGGGSGNGFQQPGYGSIGGGGRGVVNGYRPYGSRGLIASPGYGYAGAPILIDA